MDFTRLENELFVHGRAAFEKIRAERPADHFYCFGLYTSGEFAFAAATASSYEGLEEAAVRYRAMTSFSSWAVEDLRRFLKWSPCDSPLHHLAGVDFEAMEPTMAEIVGIFDSIEEEAFPEFCEQVHDAFIRALHRLDESGVFGTAEEREAVIVNLLLGDQSDEDRLDYAARLNSESQVKKLAIEFEDGHRSQASYVHKRKKA